MKRFFLSLLAVAGMLTACNMNELESVNRAGDRIGFLTTTNGLTKAVDVTTANLTAFTVEAFNHNTVASPYMNAVAFTGAAGTFESAEPYYWPEGALDFYAYSQGAAEGQVVKSDFRTFNITPAATPASQVDFVYAGVTNQTKAGSTEGAIALNFRHTESKIVVQVKNTAPNLKFEVDAWKVGYLDEAGTFTYNGNETNAYDATTVGAGTLDAGMWSNNTTFSASNTYTNTLASSVNIAASSSSPTLLGGEMILIPQVTTAADAYASASAEALVNGSYVAVKIKILNRANDAVIYSDGAGSSAWAIWPVAFNWEPGKKYTYTLDLAGGGYYEVNNDTDADLDAILAGAVISFASVTVDDFSQQSAVELVAPAPALDPVYTFAGLQIAPAPLYHNGTSFIIKDDDWNHDSYNSVYGAAEGSYYFNWNECHAVSDISYGGFDDWRMPSNYEWEEVTSDSRTGSTINGTEGCCYALIQLTGVTHAGNSSPIGLLLAPDGETMTGMSKVFTWNDDISGNTGVTAAQLDEYLDAGCVFLPASGDFDGYSWDNAGSYGYYWSRAQFDSTGGYRLSFYSSRVDSGSFGDKASEYYPCRLVREAE